VSYLSQTIIFCHKKRKEKTMIREAVETYLTSKPPRRVDSYLWVSDLGMHPAKAMRRVLKGEMEKFDVATQVKMASGSALEADTLDALRFSHPGLLTQFPLWNDTWSGYADFVLGHGSEEVTIIEHKAQGNKWWDYKESLPKSTHVLQLWLYGQLYRERFGTTPRLLLYYRGWDEYAEFDIPCVGFPEGGPALLTGRIDGRDTVRRMYIAPHALRAEMEQYYLIRTIPQLAEEEGDWSYPEKASRRLLTQGVQ
jgi:hypothetical protein